MASCLRISLLCVTSTQIYDANVRNSRQNTVTDELKIENGLGFKLSRDNFKLLAVVIPCENKIELTTDVIKKRLEPSFTHLFIDDFLLSELSYRYNNATNETFEFEIGEQRDAHCEISFSDNKMQARLTLTPNFGGKEVTLDDVHQLLKENKIVRGIVDNQTIKDVLKKGYFENFVIAEGLATVDGIDAQFESLVMLETRSRKPMIDSEGVVDYRELGDIVIVHQDDELMRRIPAVVGKKGYNVLGDVLEPRPGENTPFSNSIKGVYVDPKDKNKLLSSIVGQPMLIPNGIVVSPVLTVDQVDLSSGNIRFDGSVIVLGDVEVGMKVYAVEDITIEGNVTDAEIECLGDLNIKGCVTGGSELISSGNISINGGVKGDTKSDLKMSFQGFKKVSNPHEGSEISAKIVASGSVMTDFAENFRIEAGIDIVIDKYAMNNQLLARNKIVVGLRGVGRKPSIIGGMAWAMIMVKASIIGSSSGMKTFIRVGSDPCIQKQIKEIKNALVLCDKEQESIHKILEFIDNNPEKGNAEMLEKLHHTLDKLVIESELHHAELNELTANIALIDNATVIAERGVYVGTEIYINNVMWRAQENRSKSIFSVEHHEMFITN